MPPDAESVSFTCPRCGRTSHNPHDAREGYCGACHGWTRVDEERIDEIIRLRALVGWLAQTVHQAHHDGPLEECPRVTCKAALAEIQPTSG